MLLSEIASTDELLTAQRAHLNSMLPCPPGEEYCQRCDQVTGCRVICDSHYVDLLWLMNSHFTLEANAMHLIEVSQKRRNGFEDHHEAHANLMQRLLKMVGNKYSPAEERVARLQLLDQWLREHFATHDAPLITALKQV